jgi:hypothetical protein
MVAVSASVPQRIDHKVKSCGGLAAAGIEKVITRVGLAPNAKDAL